MKDLLEQIKKSLDNNLYYLSLFAALILPDICGAINSENGEASKEKYIQWFNEYIAEKYHGCLNGKDCYYFRCSLLHQGSSQHSKSNYSRILFIEPVVTEITAHCNIINDALNIDIRIFCNDIIEGVEKWLSKVKDTELYKNNCDKFMRRYPNGLKPYIVGVPIIS